MLLFPSSPSWGWFQGKPGSNCQHGDFQRWCPAAISSQVRWMISVLFAHDAVARCPHSDQTGVAESLVDTTPHQRGNWLVHILHVKAIGALLHEFLTSCRNMLDKLFWHGRCACKCDDNILHDPFLVSKTLCVLCARTCALFMCGPGYLPNKAGRHRFALLADAKRPGQVKWAACSQNRQSHVLKTWVEG